MDNLVSFLSATVFEGTCQVTLHAQACWCLSFQRPFDLTVDPWACRHANAPSFVWAPDGGRCVRAIFLSQEESFYSLVSGCPWQSSVLLTSSELAQLSFCCYDAAPGKSTLKEKRLILALGFHGNSVHHGGEDNAAAAKAWLQEAGWSHCT